MDADRPLLFVDDDNIEFPVIDLNEIGSFEKLLAYFATATFAFFTLKDSLDGDAEERAIIIVCAD